MRILVSGAAGFLGSSLTRALRRRHRSAVIVGCDNLWTGQWRDRDGLTSQVTGDFEHCVWGRGWDQVYHLASPASPIHYQSDPMRTVRANALGTMRALESADPHTVLFFASTSEVYGDPRVSPQPESYWGSVNPIGVRSCYDESKRVSETMLADAARRGQCRVKIARLFNVYGPGTLPDDGRAVSNFITRALRHQSIQVQGDGLQTRAFTYVDDVVEGILRLTHDTPDDFWGPLNLGTGRETPILEIAEHVRASVRPSVEIEHVAAAQDDPRQRLPDLALARATIGWDPRVTWEDGIGRTVAYFRDVLGIAS